MQTMNKTNQHLTIRDRSGEDYGTWRVLRYAGTVGRSRSWICVCRRCGRQSCVTTSGLHRKPRGCSKCSPHRVTHGQTHSPEFRTWQSMIKRCNCRRGRMYRDYAARGITVCPRWRESFEAFLEDMGPRPSPKHSIDRFPDQNGNYEPGNCRWATWKEQLQNTRRNRALSFNGKTQCVSEWARELGVGTQVLFNRLNRGWSVERTLTQPKQVKCMS